MYKVKLLHKRCTEYRDKWHKHNELYKELVINPNIDDDAVDLMLTQAEKYKRLYFATYKVLCDEASHFVDGNYKTLIELYGKPYADAHFKPYYYHHVRGVAMYLPYEFKHEGIVFFTSELDERDWRIEL